MAAAVHAARTTPPRLEAFHAAMVAPPSLGMPQHLPILPPGAMDHKQYLPLSFPDTHFPSFPFHHFPPPLPPPPPVPAASRYHDEEMDEDIDEDDMSDLDEELQQELMAYRRRQLEPDMTRQLLSFADRVSMDIHKVFGRKKGDEDSCDVYEDKWTVTKSGRELYYADLLKIAQGDFGDSKSSSSKVSETSRHKNVEILEDNRDSFSGRADSALGLGPLDELFEQGFQAGKQKKGSSHNSAGKRQKADSEASASKAVPMHKRTFPNSFWQEPGTTNHPTGIITLDLPAAPSSLHIVHSLSSGKLPDFSDLMDSWNGDQAQLQQQQLHTLQSMQHPNQHHQQHHQQRTSVFDTIADSSRKRGL